MIALSIFYEFRVFRIFLPFPLSLSLHRSYIQKLQITQLQQSNHVHLVLLIEYLLILMYLK